MSLLEQATALPAAFRADLALSYARRSSAVSRDEEAVGLASPRGAKGQVEELKKTRYIWLKNKCNLSEAQLAALGGLTDLNLKTARAYQIRLTFQDLYAQPSREAAEAFLKKWYFWATHSRLKPVIEAAGTIKRHWDGILRWFDSKIANGILEGINSLVQAAKAKARGYRSTRNLKAIIYLIAGKLELKLPT